MLKEVDGARVVCPYDQPHSFETNDAERMVEEERHRLRGKSASPDVLTIDIDTDRQFRSVTHADALKK